MTRLHNFTKERGMISAGRKHIYGLLFCLPSALRIDVRVFFFLEQLLVLKTCGEILS